MTLAGIASKPSANARRRAITRFALMSFVLMFSAVAPAQTTAVWEIGKYDQSALEFNAGPQKQIVYTVGKSDWTKDWPGVQRPGSAYMIDFELSAVPHGVFSLKVSALKSYQRIPALEIQVNGKKGIYYLHPKSLYLADQQYRSFDVLTIAIPARYLNKGENSITFEVVDAESDDSASTAPAGSVAYDYISLTNDARAKYKDGLIQEDVIPTIFYRNENGKLVELVDAYLRFSEGKHDGLASLTINGERVEAKVPSRSEFGEELVEFPVPEWQGTVRARLEVAGGVRHSLDLSLTAARKWTIFVVPHTHLDVGFTDYQAVVAQNQADTLVDAAKLIKKHPDFRFATDGSWNLQQLLETKSEAQRDEVLDLIRNGKMEIPANYANLLTGNASLETLYRSLYYSKKLANQYHLPFTHATTTDVPTYTGSYPSVLASAGIKYWAVGGNADRAPLLADEHWNEKSPFWWEGPDGQKVLFWYARFYAQIAQFLTATPREVNIRESLPIFFDQYDKSGYKPDAVLMYGARGENIVLQPELATFATAWNSTYAFPRLQYATFTDFFTYIDQHYGSVLPTYKGNMGPYWEDGIGSDAFYAAIDRGNQATALTAEITGTVSHLVDPTVHPPESELDSGWNNILMFNEHTWGALNSVSQPDTEEATRQLAVKDNYATQAELEFADIRDRSMSELVQHIQVLPRTLVVFNGLSWKRDALVDVDLNENQELLDLSTHEVVPYQIVLKKDRFVRARFLARDLPPVGYKCFQIRPASGNGESHAAANTNPVIENRYYRITIDPESGAVRSIFDKQLQRELADQNGPYRFGQYLYVTGGDATGIGASATAYPFDGPTRIVHPFKALPVAELAVHPSANGRYLGSEKTPWGYDIKLQSEDTNTPEIGLEILLYDDEKKIEFRYTVKKDYTREKEGVYFAFPTSVSSPEFAYATQQGWVDPARDLFKGASLEWSAVQKWMAVHDDSLTVGIVPIDSPLANFGDINRGLWPSEFRPKTSTMFSYAMNNYWWTNYRAGQGGTFTFRYVLTSAAHFDGAALSRLGWESMEAPGLSSVVSPEPAADPEKLLPEQGASFLEVSSPNVVLVTWKLAEDGKGTILRLQETAGQSADVTVTIQHSKVQSAALSNSVEDTLSKLSVVSGRQIHLTFHPHEVLTVRLTP